MKHDTGLVHLSSGVAILIGLISSEYSGGEALLAVLLSCALASLTAACGPALNSYEEEFKRKKLQHFLHFLMTWFEALINISAAAACARIASATVDYITKGHFREFLFGLESHSLGEPWPDVLGVTIIVIVTILFMLGLERSFTTAALLIISLAAFFFFFVNIGSFHTVHIRNKWFQNFKIRSVNSVLTASAISTFGFMRVIPKTGKRDFLKFSGALVIPLVVYSVMAVIFALMARYRELSGTAIPLIRIFEVRDVDWARPVMAVGTIAITTLAITEILPKVFCVFMKLASKEWQVFASSLQYQSSLTGAPILTIFAAGSLAAILSFSCPVSYLIKLLNTSTLIKFAINSCQLLIKAYKPEIYSDEFLVYQTNVQYSKLNQNSTKPKKSFLQSFKSIFTSNGNKTISRINITNPINTDLKQDERDCLLMDDYSLKIDNEDSCSENEDTEILSKSDDESTSSTDIDVVVQEYREGLQVKTVTKFNERKPSTKTSFAIVLLAVIIIIICSIFISLYVLKLINLVWPFVGGLCIALLVMICMPQNSEEKPSQNFCNLIVFPLTATLLITTNTLLSSMIIADVWEGVLVWIVAGIGLFWRCDCITCEGVLSSGKSSGKVGPTECDYRDADAIFITR